MAVPADYGLTYAQVAAAARSYRKSRLAPVRDLAVGVEDGDILEWLRTCQEQGLDIGLPRDVRGKR